jgi:hypothetical protein
LIISLGFNVLLLIYNVDLLMSLLYVLGLLGLAGLSYIDRDLVKSELEKRLTLCLFFMGFLLVFLLLVLCYTFDPSYFKICLALLLKMRYLFFLFCIYAFFTLFILYALN